MSAQRDEDFLSRGRAARRFAVLAVLVAVLLGGALVAVFATRDAAAPSGSRTAPPGRAEPTPVESAPAGPFRLVQGARTEHGVPVGYPHSLAGAVSAAVHYWAQIASTLDARRAAEIAGAVADPSWRDAARELAEGPAQTRKALGLPAKGATGADVLLTPAAYQVRNATADSVTVLVLGYYQTTLPDGDVDTRIGVYPAQMRWVAGDWKMPRPTLSDDFADLRAAPGSDEAAALGWKPLSE
ncbi:hypothetical protein [Actinomadura atramentaria]|uniref:hypothetical protein n=1 Tax=Actinomadura atramentaria TaxID=1990 RepID=UPI000376BE3F|nr:hypothetical protein [Actinomadura atramentaria]